MNMYPFWIFSRDFCGRHYYFCRAWDRLQNFPIEKHSVEILFQGFSVSKWSISRKSIGSPHRVVHKLSGVRYLKLLISYQVEGATGIVSSSVRKHSSSVRGHSTRTARGQFPLGRIPMEVPLNSNPESAIVRLLVDYLLEFPELVSLIMSGS